MSRPAKFLFFVVTAAPIAAAIEPFLMYTATTIHVSATERATVAMVCLGVLIFTVGVWRQQSWMLPWAVACDAAFGLWYLHALWGTLQAGNYTRPAVLIGPLLWALTPF